MKRPLRLGFVSKLDSHLREDPALLQVILGPRQVGKTTGILDYLEHDYKHPYHYVSADNVFNAHPTWLKEQWGMALQDDKTLVIDEIQKCENWAETIKALWDLARKEKRRVRCVLLGSSSLEIQKGLTESLTGRFILHFAYHWNLKESLKAFNLDFDSYLKHGGYPGSYRFIGRPDWELFVRNSIVSTVIEKDILQFHNIKSPALFRQAFEILTAYPAQEVSYTKLLGQLQERGNVELIKHYIRLFEGAFLLKSLQKYSQKVIQTKSSSPKIMPLAPCLYFLNILDDYTAEERGHAFECIVGSQLVRTGWDLYYWREGQVEVDFILKKGRRVWAIEVKSGRKKNSQGLIKFKEKFPTSKCVIIDPKNYIDFENDPIDFLEKSAW